MIDYYARLSDGERIVRELHQIRTHLKAFAKFINEEVEELSGFPELGEAIGRRQLYPQRHPSIFSKETVDRLLQHSSPSDDWIEARDRAVVALAYFAGAEPGELSELNIEDIDQEKRTVRLRGGKPKHRVNPLHESIEIVKDYLSKRPRGKGWTPALLLNEMDASRLTAQQITDRFRTYATRVGVSLPKGLSLRNLPLSFVEHQKMSRLQAQEFLGYVDFSQPSQDTPVSLEEKRRLVALLEQGTPTPLTQSPDDPAVGPS